MGDRHKDDGAEQTNTPTATEPCPQLSTHSPLLQPYRHKSTTSSSPPPHHPAVRKVRVPTNMPPPRANIRTASAPQSLPLLLQLFCWYALLTTALPPPRSAWQPLAGLFISVFYVARRSS